MIAGFDNLIPLLTPLERRVLAALADRRGTANAVHVPDLAREVGVHPRKLQDVIATLSVGFGPGIGSSLACGLFMIETLAEADAVFRHHQARAMSNHVRASAIRKWALSKYGVDLEASDPQLDLPFDPSHPSDHSPPSHPCHPCPPSNPCHPCHPSNPSRPGGE